MTFGGFGHFPHFGCGPAALGSSVFNNQAFADAASQARKRPM
jgi:hypothetical protein